MMNNMKKATLVFAVFMVFMASVVAFTTWHGGVQWQIAPPPTEDFTVWKDAEGTVEWLESDFHQLGELTPPVTHEVTYYLQNTGDVEIIVEPQMTVQEGCTVSWSDGGLGYTLPTVGTIIPATLTLEITGAGSYEFDFVIAP